MEDIFGPVTIGLILASIMGLVEFGKQFGLEGKGAALAALVGGVVLGVLYQANLGPIFDIVIYGILLGLSASGFYTIAKRIGGDV